MRKLSYGMFLNQAPVEDAYDWDCMPIGMHGAIKQSEERNSRTLHGEYYYKKDGMIHIVRDANGYEKMATILRRTKKIVGYVSSSIIDKPLNEKPEKPASEMGGE